MVDDGVGDGWPLVAEVDDAADAAGVVDLAERGGEVKTGEKVAGEQRFGEPDRAVASGAFETDPREVDFEAELFLKVSGGNVLVFGLGTQTEPQPDRRIGLVDGWINGLVD